MSAPPLDIVIDFTFTAWSKYSITYEDVVIININRTVRKKTDMQGTWDIPRPAKFKVQDALASETKACTLLCIHVTTNVMY